MLAMLAGLVPPLAVGFLLARRAWPAEGGLVGWYTALHTALGVALGLGLASLTFFWWCVCAGPHHPGLAAVELLLFVALGTALLLQGHSLLPLSPLGRGVRGEGATCPRPLRLAFLFVAACATTTAIWYLWHSPHGDWDAWAIWNLRARFLYRGGTSWTDAFSPLILWAHPDYPLLVPGNVARAWSYAGTETTLAPQLLAALFTAATAGLLTAALAVLRHPSQGYLGGLTLLATPFFLQLGTAQYADVPLALYFLASAAAFEAIDRRGPCGPRAALAGLLTSLAAWTKNEGLLFVTATLVVRIGVHLQRQSGPRGMARELAAFIVGALPGLLTVSWFKLRLAPVNDLLAGQGLGPTWSRLIDPQRYVQIATALAQEVVLISPGLVGLLVYLLLVGRAPRSAGPRLGHAVGVLVLMLAGYLTVYLITPNNLPAHLATSFDRVLMQLWPTVLFAFFLATSTPQESWATAQERAARKLTKRS